MPDGPEFVSQIKKLLAEKTRQEAKKDVSSGLWVQNKLRYTLATSD